MVESIKPKFSRGDAEPLRERGFSRFQGGPEGHAELSRKVAFPVGAGLARDSKEGSMERRAWLPQERTVDGGRAETTKLHLGVRQKSKPQIPTWQYGDNYLFFKEFTIGEDETQ